MHARPPPPGPAPAPAASAVNAADNAADTARWLQASALPARWQGQAVHALLLWPFVNHSFLALWRAWRDDARRPGRLVVCSAIVDPPVGAGTTPPADPGCELATQLARAWPPATDNLHILDFDGGRVRLLLAIGPRDALRQARQLQADTLWLTEPGADPQALARRAAPGAWLLAGAAGSEAWQTGLRRAGWTDSETVPPMPAAAGLARWRLPADARPGRRPGLATCSPSAVPGNGGPLPGAAGHAVVVGAGIAGASAAAALARRGWQCTVLDALPATAGGASGNPAALVHGTVHAADGTHARFNRAAALHAQRLYAALLAQGVPGALQGLLRRQAELPACLAPPAWAQLWPADALRARASGLCAEQAWFFPGAGWVDARATVQALLATPGVHTRVDAAVSQLCRQGDDWCAHDATGQLLARAPILVLALAATGATQPPAHPRAASLAELLHQAGALPCPLGRSRGQITWFDSAHAGRAPLPWPVAGGGYALFRSALGADDPPATPPSPGPGIVLCGASTQAGDDDGRVRAADHAYNLARLQAQTGIAPAAGAALQGRVGWREYVRDKLPLVGPVVAQAGLPALHQPRLAMLPRVPGLFVLGALAGRGFTWGPLAGEVLASQVDGQVVPLEGDLIDALDPGRFWLREQRRAKPP